MQEGLAHGWFNNEVCEYCSHRINGANKDHIKGPYRAGKVSVQFSSVHVGYCHPHGEQAN